MLINFGIQAYQDLLSAPQCELLGVLGNAGRLWRVKFFLSAHIQVQTNLQDSEREEA